MRKDEGISKTGSAKKKNLRKQKCVLIIFTIGKKKKNFLRWGTKQKIVTATKVKENKA